jgi:lipoprotein-anchoring transpeptidase ErfK/SrfK
MRAALRPRRARFAVLLLAPVLLLLAAPRQCAAAQQPSALPPAVHDQRPGTPLPPAGPAAEAGRHVRISLEERRLYVMEGEQVVWSALVGVGTGETLATAGRSWEFSTPRGVFQVQRKERDPVWFLPDWVFVKRGEPIPSDDSPRRRAEGMLGAAALYLSPEIAIHGTDEPELLGHEVSHGCIRMSNEDVRRLYREMDVGSPVLIY